MKRRNLSKPTAIKILDELDVKKGIGLIERVWKAEHYLCKRFYEYIGSKRN